MNGKKEAEIKKKKRKKRKTKETKDDKVETIKRQRKALAFVVFYSILHVSCRQHFVLVSLGTVSFQLTDDVGSIIDKSV